MHILDIFIMGLILIFGGYAFLWAVPAVFILAILALNDINRIEFIDQQLAKDVKKLHSRLDYQLSFLTYPNI